MGWKGNWCNNSWDEEDWKGGKKHKAVKRKESCRTVQSDPCVLLFAAKTSELKRNTSVFDNICLEREFCDLKASFLIKEMT